MNPRIVPIILSDGAGTRLRPLSREHHPKQLIPLLGENTPLQATVRRLGALDHATAPIVVCNDEHRFMVARQLDAINVAPSAILLEPVTRNTAPAIAAAAFEALAQSSEGEDPILPILPADHVIRDETGFAEAVRRAVREACAGRNESTYIPQRVRHRLENAGTVTLELIEVQSGSYLGEDDIVRFDDAYGRVDRGPRQA